MIIAGPVIAVGWHLYEGARTPDQPILSSRREEPGRLSIAKSVFAVIAGSKPRLRNNRNDGLGDDISLTVKADRYDRVDIQDIPGLLIRSGIEVGVILERGTDQIGHRIQRGLASASLLRPDRAAEWHARAKQPQQHYPTYRYNTYRPPHPLRTVYTRYLRLNVNAGLVKHV
jgi:hypothetical protein